jgi:hypothetical protein
VTARADHRALHRLAPIQAEAGRLLRHRRLPGFLPAGNLGIRGLKSLAYGKRGYAQALLVVLIAGLSVGSTVGYFDAVTKQPWREVAGYVDGHGRAGDFVLLYGGSLPFDYYSERKDVDREAFRVATNAGMRKSISAMIAGRERVWLVGFWETGRARKALPAQLRRLYGEATHKKVYAVTDTYNNEVATVPYQGDGIYLLLFEGLGTR